MAPPLCGRRILFVPPFFLLLSLGSSFSVPRKTFPYQQEELRLFREEGVWNYSTMLLREEQGVVVLGAREAIYALDLHNVSSKKASVHWRVTEEKQRDCTYKGRQAGVECRNYIQILHPVNRTTLYVCGTNAFSPACDYLTYADGRLLLAGRQEEGKGKCPFDPFQRYASLMVGKDLYSATFINFLGSEPVVLRSSLTSVRSEFKSSWLNEPTFISMDLVPESVDSGDGDDDKLYMFFSENAMEYDFYSKLTVSRVGRVCKEDMGGQRTLQRKWTSFVKARLDCSLPAPSLPPIVQDVFLLKHANWRRSVFYAVFTPQSGSSRLSAVCAFSVSAIREVFNEGKFKTPVAVETSHVKWVMYSGELPVPRPGACINNAARKLGMKSSLDLPDRTLQFIRDRPLMDEAVRPLGGGPLLVTRGAALTRIVVDSVRALDGQTYPVMFVGTDNGFIQKAVNYGGEMFVIEEVQVYQDPQPISTLRLSSSKGQVYAGSASGVVQMPVSSCGRQRSCWDCVLARDPYCAWDLGAGRCSPVAGGGARRPASEVHSPAAAVQSLTDGDTSRCPPPEPVPVVVVTVVPGNNIQLPCSVDSSAAEVLWLRGDQPLPPGPRVYLYDGGLLLLNASGWDAGAYTCCSVERTRGRTHNSTAARYRLQLTGDPAIEQRPGEEKGEGGEAAVGDGAGQSLDGVRVPKATVPAPAGPPGAQPEGHQLPETQAGGGRVVGLQVAVAGLALLCLALAAGLLWMGQRAGKLRWLPWGRPAPPESKSKSPGAEYGPVPAGGPSEEKTPEPMAEPGRPCAGNNNHRAGLDSRGNGHPVFTSMADISCLDGLGYIHDESEI